MELGPTQRVFLVPKEAGFLEAVGSKMGKVYFAAGKEMFWREGSLPL